MGIKVIHSRELEEEHNEEGVDVMSVEFFGHSYIGKKRRMNEDQYLCLDLSGEARKKWRPLNLLAVADGVGGQAGGAMASSLAIDSLQEFVRHRLKESGPFLRFQEILEQSFLEANRRVFQKASENGIFTGMGTTLVAALIHKNKAIVSNVGDSRIYHVREGTMRQISHDHSWAAEQIRLKILSERDIRNSPFKSVITRSLGIASQIQTDTFQVRLNEEDYLLLCSDGLHSALSDGEMLEVFKKYKRPEEICLQLIESADHQGSQDNVTAVVAFYHGNN
ncbi:MAG: protein phosphatase 2C domain-containing protein [Candidatus Aminicenantales bacterium]